jgi:putative transposase
VGRSKEAIAQYIRAQLQEDIVADQLSSKELIDLLMGEPVNKS